LVRVNAASYAGPQEPPSSSLITIVNDESSFESYVPVVAAGPIVVLEPQPTPVTCPVGTITFPHTKLNAKSIGAKAPNSGYGETDITLSVGSVPISIVTGPFKNTAESKIPVAVVLRVKDPVKSAFIGQNLISVIVY
tara:strand:+ start:368 stop:778 length:411 start_codon:yes stop_codon:yes gene_type:complete